VSPGFGGTTVYSFYTINTDGKPEVQFKRLKRLVGGENLNLRPPRPEPGTWHCDNAVRKRGAT